MNVGLVFEVLWRKGASLNHSAFRQDRRSKMVLLLLSARCSHNSHLFHLKQTLPFMGGGIAWKDACWIGKREIQ